MIEHLLLYISAHLSVAPYAIFGLLILGGLNLPISEDALIFLSATLASQFPENTFQLFLGTYLGVYFSGTTCYWLARLAGRKLLTRPFFSKFFHEDLLQKVNSFYNRYGVITLIVGRFIPFGFRNALFISAGLSKMKFVRFALFDLAAATFACSVYFSLYYFIGHEALLIIQRGGLILFIIIGLLIGILLFYFRKSIPIRSFQKRFNPSKD